MMSKKDKKLFFKLLGKSNLFDKSAKLVVKRAVEAEVLPELDFNYFLFVMKTEQNLLHIVDKRAEKMIQDLKKPHKKS